MKKLLILPLLAMFAGCCPDDARKDATKHPVHITGPGYECTGTLDRACTGHHCEWTVKCQDDRTYFNASNFSVGN